MRRLVLAGALILSGPPDSRAEPAPDLRAHALPFLPRLTMRTAAAQPAPAAPVAPAGAARAPTPAPADPLTFERSAPRPPSDLTASERFAQLAERVRAQLTIGFAVDGAEPSARARTVAGNGLATEGLDQDTYLAKIGYARARAYMFGDAMLGVDGVGDPGISTYFAAQFRITPSNPTFAPVATAWDELDDLQLRAAWTEADGVFEEGVLKSLVLRGGRQFVYGPQVVHVDGVRGAWGLGGFSISGYFGARVPTYYEANPLYPEMRAQRGLVAGVDVAGDLRRVELPFQVRLRMMAFENHGHGDLTVDWSARDDLIATGIVRTFDGKIVREHLTARYRVSDETRLVVDGDFQQRGTPVWDYAFYDPQEIDAARRYLDLGPSLPRIAAKARAGTVILDNVDVLLHGGFALDARLRSEEVSYHAAGWLETGTALEVRVRRAVMLGLSGLARTYRHHDPPGPEVPGQPGETITDFEDVVQPLELQPIYTGERNLFEGGGSARFSGGARKFSASGEIYIRRTKYAERYQNDPETHPDGPVGTGDNENEQAIGQIDWRGGGRFAFEAWITPNLRIRTEYDLSSEIDNAPEILGLKTLRVLAEGTF